MSYSEKSKKVPKTLRLEEELIKRFCVFCEENNLNQSDGFEQLLVTMELNRASITIPSRETEINYFKGLVNAIQNAFITSLEICENTEVRIGEKFRRELETRGKVISDYQGKIEFLESELEKANQKALNYDVIARETATLKTTLSEKEDFIRTLQRQVSKLDAFEDLQEEVAKLRKELLEKEKEMRELCEKHTAEVFELMKK